MLVLFCEAAWFGSSSRSVVEMLLYLLRMNDVEKSLDFFFWSYHWMIQCHTEPTEITDTNLLGIFRKSLLLEDEFTWTTFIMMMMIINVIIDSASCLCIIFKVKVVIL